MTQGDKPRLQDMLNYAPEEHLSKEEMSLLRNTFKGNEKLIRVLRKVMIPTSNDPDLPIEEFAKDSYIVDRDWAQIPAEEAKTIMLARQDALKFIFGGLIKLKVLANEPVEDEDKTKERRAKDSVK